MAQDAGHESTCSRDRGLLGAKDWHLITIVISGDYTLVTNNSKDFRALHAETEIHAGLICLNSHFSMDLERQRRLFGYALSEVAERLDLINQALEVFEKENGEVTIEIYDIPKSTFPLG